MRWLPVAVIVAGWAFAGWQNMPRVSDPQSSVAGVGIALSCLVCWWIGRRSGRAAAVAVATARAEARAAAAAVAGATATNQVVLNVDVGGRSQAARDFGGLERAEWIEGPRALLEQDTAGMAAEEMAGELVEDAEREEA